ncbi:peptidase C65 Otubain-domain-containing protein [Podospora australis]|uniref:ubiquitinyl hydrolase 1 n=1 Tax=Podospora australis TaxID=1536484 RepID=A0AAN6WYU7_9PEZI|nr:peptidase C65 Otubain-domain-containing protein [Podospora australis]
MLPQTYSHYRQVQGDGNCGWRAVAFGYFELLIKAGRKEQLVSEKVRLESLNGLIEATTGLSPYVFENFVEETTALLARMSEIMHNPQQAMAELYQAFNNPEVSNSVMYHFRLLASAYLKGNTETYAAFVTDERGVDGYCSSTLERHHVEIDHLGLTLLVNVLLKPINFVLEVAYLDRSAGAEVNTYRFPEELNGEDPRTLGPMIHLLYRPDHYDILYPTESVPESTAVQVHRVGFSQSYEVAAAPVGLHNFGVVNLNPLSLIPGFGTTASILDTTPSPLSAYNLSPASQWMASRYAADSPQPVAPMTAVTPAAPVMVPMPEICPVRFSEYCKLPEYIENDTWREPSFQTIMFKNSHFNVAHYNNPNFQPEEYVPDLEEYDAPPRIRKKRASV